MYHIEKLKKLKLSQKWIEYEGKQREKEQIARMAEEADRKEV